MKHMQCLYAVLLSELISSMLQVHFINHFSGCQLCTAQNKNEDYKECETEFVKSFEYANSIMMKMLARKPARNITMHAQLASLPHCKVGILPVMLGVQTRLYGCTCAVHLILCLCACGQLHVLACCTCTKEMHCQVLMP